MERFQPKSHCYTHNILWVSVITCTYSCMCTIIIWSSAGWNCSEIQKNKDILWLFWWEERDFLMMETYAFLYTYVTNTSKIVDILVDHDYDDDGGTNFRQEMSLTFSFLTWQLAWFSFFAVLFDLTFYPAYRIIKTHARTFRTMKYKKERRVKPHLLVMLFLCCKL